MFIMQRSFSADLAAGSVRDPWFLDFAIPWNGNREVSRSFFEPRKNRNFEIFFDMSLKYSNSALKSSPQNDWRCFSRTVFALVSALDLMPFYFGEYSEEVCFVNSARGGHSEEELRTEITRKTSSKYSGKRNSREILTETIAKPVRNENE